MSENLRIFVDFWNFQISWNERTNKAPLDWTKFSQVMLAETKKIIGLENCKYHGTNVYASVDMTKKEGGNLKAWLTNFLDRQPGINTDIRERRPRPKSVHCKNCDVEIINCPSCQKPILRAGEKGVDAAIVTDMFSLAWAGAFSIAILVSSDADYVPAVENLQNKGFKIVNATWRNLGHQLAKRCWASFEMDPLIDQLLHKNH
jgi:uncharacterized LabA/DUF88 family protein